jgi:phosphatidylcholine synthase
MRAAPSDQRLNQRPNQRPDQRLRALERRVRSNRSAQRNAVTKRAVVSAMLWGISIGTVLILLGFVFFGSLLVFAATAVIVYLAFNTRTARQRRWRSLRGDAHPAGALGLPQLKPAYLIHCLTAAGIIPAALAMLEITRVDCDPRWVFVYLIIATLIDAVDGPLARRWDVKTNAASIDGRTIDDVLDYLTFAFIPLMLIWRMNWMPAGLGFTVMLAMAASLLGFSHREAKDEQRGVFRGFPSYWNLYAIYAGIFSVQISPWLTATMLWLLTILTVAPVWVLYPNLAPQKWKRPLMIGGAIWTALLLAMLWDYPDTSLLLTAVSLLYPIFYTYVSIQHARNTTRTLSKLRDQHAVG